MAKIDGLASGCATQTRLVARLAKWSALSGLAAGCLFLLLPQIDLALARSFYLGDGHFAGDHSVVVALLRSVFMWSYAAAAVLVVAGIAMSLQGGRTWLHLEAKQWLFLALCLGIGPGVVANQIFKDNWGRARPKQVLEFSGGKEFTPALFPARNCERNCSFVSGEASSIFVMFFAAAALWRRRPRVMIASGIMLGGVAGLMRMTQGAHFLSDVVFAGVFMALTVSALFLLFEAGAAGGVTRIRLAFYGEAAAA